MEEFDLTAFTAAFEAEMRAACTDVTLASDPDEFGVSWWFNAADVSGYASVESEGDDSDDPTVTIMVGIANSNDLSKEELLELMFRSSGFQNASLVALPNPEDESSTLFIQFRVLAEEYNGGDFPDVIEYLLEQADTYLFMDDGEEDA